MKKQLFFGTLKGKHARLFATCSLKESLSFQLFLTLEVQKSQSRELKELAIICYDSRHV